VGSFDSDSEMDEGFFTFDILIYYISLSLFQG
jgi:hypothetical protein